MNTIYKLSGSEVERVPAARLSPEERKVLVGRWLNKFCPAPGVTLCRECFAREVGEKGRICPQCVEMIARRERMEADRKAGEKLRNALLLSLASGGIIIWLALYLAGK